MARSYFLNRHGLSSLLVASVVVVMAFGYCSNPVNASATVSSLQPLLMARASHTSTLYVVASTGCDVAPSCLELFRTTDEVFSLPEPDPSFTRVNLPPVGEMNGRLLGTLQEIVFATPLIGYAVEGSTEPEFLWVTTNGARTWHKVALPDDGLIYGLTTTGPHLYALIIEHHGIGPCCTRFHLDHADLSATNWSGVSVAKGPNRVPSVLGEVTAVGENVFFSQQHGSEAVLYTSHNGGVTFQKSVHQNLASTSGCTLTGTTTKKVWAECSSDGHRSFHFSNNAGRAWFPYVRTHRYPKSVSFFATAGDGFSYFGIGAPTTIVYRINIGARRAHAIGSLDCSDVVSMLFMSGSHAYAICQNATGRFVLDRSIDGAESWRPVRL